MEKTKHASTTNKYVTKTYKLHRDIHRTWYTYNIHLKGKMEREPNLPVPLQKTVKTTCNPRCALTDCTPHLGTVKDFLQAQRTHCSLTTPETVKTRHIFLT